tara:strand:+ start:1127 stop:1354 length:228 start_codon:yes stop_codon:yes gene_type:complete
MLRVRDATVYRADFNALPGFMATNTLGAFIYINYINYLPFSDCLIRTFRFTGATTDTFICNFICHKIYSLLILYL